MENGDRGLYGPDDDRPDLDRIRPAIPYTSDNPSGGPPVHHATRPQLSD